MRISSHLNISTAAEWDLVYDSESKQNLYAFTQLLHTV
jgi:hypothetical protein